jgi:hypothetical protein
MFCRSCLDEIVSAPHRRAAFEACEWVIRELKRTVPIWKKEVFEDGGLGRRRRRALAVGISFAARSAALPPDVPKIFLPFAPLGARYL